MLKTPTTWVNYKGLVAAALETSPVVAELFRLAVGICPEHGIGFGTKMRGSSVVCSSQWEKNTICLYKSKANGLVEPPDGFFQVVTLLGF